MIAWTSICGPQPQCFRFLPVRFTSRDLERMHGIDERIGIREYEGAIRTYRQLLIDFTRN
jgi:acetylornithine deacetylase/succinyl-diaminopimelate desuccinylase-like protein